MQTNWNRLAPVVVFALLGVAVSAWIEILHIRLDADPNYASFCNVNERFNCDLVLSSRYAKLAGVPVSRLGALFYLLVAATALAVSRASRVTARVTLGKVVLTLALLGFLYSVYMAAVAFGILQTVCLMCSALYVVSIGLLVSAWRLQSSLRPLGRRQREDLGTSDRTVMIGGAAAVALLAVVVTYEALSPVAAASNPEEIRQKRPDFYTWFFAQPVVGSFGDAGPSRGRPEAPVTVVEFSDFQCGHCAKLHESLEQVLRRESARVRVVFRHFPLDSSCNPKIPQRFHADACLAAMAAECAEEQGRFWEYHSILFENQKQLGREFLLRYASELGLDKERFTACLASDAPRLRIQRDVEAGQRAGIDSTPTVFINGRRINGALEPQGLADAFILAAAPGK